uniref:Lipid-binding serum glycoprotein C-terminal domain-containing protein n=1 Tax=Panagrolaimus sp. JU765 TaxID=591449 RepID=A0AC34QH94_9BILA
MHWIIILLFATCSAELNIPELLKNEKHTGAAGVKSRLSPSGINYVASFLTNSLIMELVTVSLDTAPQKIATSEGDLTIKDIKLGIHRAPETIESTLSPPNSIVIRVKNLNMTANILSEGVFSGQSVLLASAAQPVFRVILTKNFRGAPNLKIEDCKLLQGIPIKSTIQNEKIKSFVEKEALELLQSLLCSRIEFIVEERINARFGLLNPKVPLANINDDVIVNDLIEKMRFARRFKRSSLISSFNVTKAENLALDYTITDVRVTQAGLEIDTFGEVSLRGRGGTYFGPQPISLPSNAHPDTMLQMVVSDFVPNSLMYHGHTIGLFNTRITPSTPHFGPIMKTTCSFSSGTLFCLGDLFPTLRKLHPNKQLSLVFNTMQAPVIRFQSQNNGGIKFTLLGTISIFTMEETNEEKLAAEMSIDVSANMKLKLSSSTVRPKISLKTISLKTLSPKILLQKELDDSVMLAREVLQRLVNDILREGIPIPVHPLFQLHKPKVKVMERALLLQTNFVLNERLLRQLTAADLRKRVIRI